MEANEIREIRLEYRKFRKGQIKYTEWAKYTSEKRKQFGEAAFGLEFNRILGNSSAAKARIVKFRTSPAYMFRVRKYCNQHLYSDIDPNEVVEIITPKKVIIRHMDVVLVEAPKTFHQGGFLGHTENDEQRWTCVSNPKNPTITITLTKRGWGDGRYKMSDEPKKFYDYNF